MYGLLGITVSNLEAMKGIEPIRVTDPSEGPQRPKETEGTRDPILTRVRRDSFKSSSSDNRKSLSSQSPTEWNPTRLFSNWPSSTVQVARGEGEEGSKTLTEKEFAAVKKIYQKSSWFSRIQHKLGRGRSFEVFNRGVKKDIENLDDYVRTSLIGLARTRLEDKTVQEKLKIYENNKEALLKELKDSSKGDYSFDARKTIITKLKALAEDRNALNNAIKEVSNREREEIKRTYQEQLKNIQRQAEETIERIEKKYPRVGSRMEEGNEATVRRTLDGREWSEDEKIVI